MNILVVDVNKRYSNFFLFSFGCFFIKKVVLFVVHSFYLLYSGERFLFIHFFLIAFIKAQNIDFPMCQSYDGVYWTMLWILDHGIWRANHKFCMNSKWQRMLCYRYCTMNASEGSNRFHKTSIKHVFNSIRSLLNVQCSIYSIIILKSKQNSVSEKNTALFHYLYHFIVRFRQQPTALNMMSIECELNSFQSETPTADDKITLY